jgi:hypothetical protein
MSNITLKMVRGLLLGTLLLTGCLALGEPAKERAFDISDLFLSLDVFPENWQEVGEIRPMGPDSSIGIGDPDDAYISYSIQKAPNNIAYYYVYWNEYTGWAEQWFDRALDTGFSDNRVSIAVPWSTPDELSYRSAHADQFHVACATLEMVRRSEVCKVIVRYEEFGVEFHSGIRPETLTLEEFNDIVCRIDAVFVARLGLSDEPIDCQSYCCGA